LALPNFPHNQTLSESHQRLFFSKGWHIPCQFPEDLTMSDQANSHPPMDVGDLEETETEDEDGFDDTDYMPRFINRLLENPPLLPNESRDEFWQVFEDFESTDLGHAKTVTEYVLVYSATVLTWEVMRYDRMKIALMRNQQRPALESLFRKTHEGAAMEGAAAGLRIAANQNAKEWFVSPASRAVAARNFEAAGYAPEAVEAEAFQRSLAALAVIDRLIASAQKRLLVFLKDLEKRYGARGAEMRVTAAHAIARVSRPQQAASKDD